MVGSLKLRRTFSARFFFEFKTAMVSGDVSKLKTGYDNSTHTGAGNLLLGDGSVQQVTSGRLKEQLRDAWNSAGDFNIVAPNNDGGVNADKPAKVVIE